MSPVPVNGAARAVLPAAPLRPGAPPRTLAETAKLFRRGAPAEFAPAAPAEFAVPLKYMLDTDICIYLTEGSYPELARRFAALQAGETVISAVTLAELRYGALTMDTPAECAVAFRGVNQFLQVIPAAPFDENAALAYGHIRLTDPKRNLRAMDKLIAAHAIALDLILITNNLRDFQKFRPALRVENWAAP